MVIDSGIRHRVRWWRLEGHCNGCGQSWPCNVRLAVRESARLARVRPSTGRHVERQRRWV